MYPGGQILRPTPGSYRQSRATSAALNQAPPVASSLAAAQVGQPLPISTSDPQLSTHPGIIPAVGTPVYGPGQPLPQATGIPTYTFSVSGVPIQQPPQAQQFAGYFPPAPGIPVTHGGGVQSFSISGAPPPQAMTMGPTQPQQFTGSVPTAQGIPITQHQPAPVPLKQPVGFLESCLNVLRCCNIMGECYRLNGSCCTGNCGDEGCCADVCGCFSGLFSFLDWAPQ